MLVWDGQDISDGLIVFDWSSHGMEFKAGQGFNRERVEEVDLAVWHWSGGEGNEEQIFRTLVRRKLGIPFFIRYDGRIFQYCDPVRVACAHASAVNPRSVGIEMQNRALVRFWRRRPRRRSYKTHLKCRNRKLLHFSPAQLDAARELALRLPIERRVPLVDWGGEPQLFTGRIPREFVKDATGHIGHFHVSRKLDPGVDVLEEIHRGFQKAA